MILTGNVLRAARHLAGLDQQALADAAGVSVNSLRRMEARGPDTLTSGLPTILKVERALLARGVECFEGGVRLSPRK